MTAFLYSRYTPYCLAYSIATLHASQAQCPAYFTRLRSISRIRGPQRRPWQPPLPEPVRRFTSSLVRTPVSSTRQNTLFLMPLQMHTTFRPSKGVRGSGGTSDNGFIAAAEGNADSGDVSVSGCEVESHPGPPKPSFVGSSPAKPLVFVLASRTEDLCPGLNCFLSPRLSSMRCYH